MTRDPRNITAGWEIPTKTYSDQPYIVQTDDGAWLCVLTTGAGHEGQAGQHVAALRSTDQGKTWSAPVQVESPDGPEASYAVLLKVPSGRIYCFYNHNTDNVRQVIADNPPYRDGFCRRVDSLGHFVFRYSDDHGQTWSPQRYDVPMREMDIDRRNPYGGDLRFFWNVGKPFIHDGAAYISVHKVGGFGDGFFTRSEGILACSKALVTSETCEDLDWETLPDGEFGLHTPPGGGPVSEEQSYSVLSDGSFYCVYRSVDGHPVCTYSRDQGHTWSEPRYKSFADGRPMKHPRAANFAWKCRNGNYLYWFHNHGGRGYEDRNPVWLVGGRETDGPDGRIIEWSQPEIVLYDDDPFVRMSYPDLVEEDGRYFLTETQKDKARVHEVAPSLIEGLWAQLDAAETAPGSILDQAAPAAEVDMPGLPALVARDNTRADYGTVDLHAGFSIECAFHIETLASHDVLLDSRTPQGQGMALVITERGTLELILNDGRTESRWDCDPGLLAPGDRHVVATVDGGPHVITFVVDGKLCDGGTHRQFGWGRFSPNLRHANGSQTIRIAPAFHGAVRHVRAYDRALTTTEAIGNWRSLA
ncbi:MAG: hypothetical protein HN904_10015 [Victivallales bacterium]|nr:hypothetical protein [Victivallales bacterium]